MTALAPYSNNSNVTPSSYYTITSQASSTITTSPYIYYPASGYYSNGTTQISDLIWDVGGNPSGVTLSRDDVGRLILRKGDRLLMPDGAVISIDDQGNYTIDDSQAKVVYQANRLREFNPYINASDLLARFIEYVGGLGLEKEEIGHLPVGLFINWLVIESARVDGDPLPPEVTPLRSNRLLKNRIRPRCSCGCHRFIKRRYSDSGFLFVNPRHAERKYNRLIKGAA